MILFAQIWRQLRKHQSQTTEDIVHIKNIIEVQILMLILITWNRKCNLLNIFQENVSVQ